MCNYRKQTYKFYVFNEITQREFIGQRLKGQRLQRMTEKYKISHLLKVFCLHMVMKHYMHHVIFFSDSMNNPALVVSYINGL